MIIGALTMKGASKNVNEHPDDFWGRVHRADELFGFGLDIGAGANKVTFVGCDLRKISDVQCDACYLPFREKAFVITVFRHSLEHVKQWPMALQEAKRISSFIFIILPKKEIWGNSEHVPYFELDAKKVKDFEYGICFFLEAHNG